MSQNDTLPATQTLAIASLVAGNTITAAAEEAGIDRTTLHRWIREDFEFQARLNGARRELQDACNVRLLGLVDSAIDVLAGELEGGNADCAMVVLRGLGLLSGAPVRIGPTNPAVLEENALVNSLNAR